MNERYIVALEISSSKIMAAIGKATPGGGLEIVAVETESHLDGVRYGIIQNLEETSLSVGRVFSRLEQRAAISPRKIRGVVVGLSGRSLRNIRTEVSLPLPDETEVDENILERLRSQAMNSAIDSSLEVVDAVPRTYRVGKIETLNPKGMVGNAVTGVYDLIVCRPEMIRNIRRTISDKLHLEVEGLVVTAMATGHLILTPDEKDLGCMLVDLGAETTTVTIYKNGGLRYFATLPMGGRNITRDIMSLGEIESRAEEIKKTSGNAVADDSDSNLRIGGLKLSAISNLVAARSEEITANILEQIRYASMKESDLSKGIVLIGGGARLNGIADLIAEQSDMPVRRGSLPDYILFDSHARANTADVIQTVSVLYAGVTFAGLECLVMPEKSELPVNGTLFADEDEEDDFIDETPKESRRSKFLDGLKRKVSAMFGNPEDDSDLI